MAAAGISCSQRLGNLVAGLDPGSEADAVRLRGCPAMIHCRRWRSRRRLRVAPRIEAMLPIGVRARQLGVRTLLAGMCLTQADGRPAHLTRVRRPWSACPKTTAKARRPRGLEKRPAPADLPASRVRLQPCRRRWPRTSPTGCRRAGSSAPEMTCWRHRSRKDSRTPAPRWRWTGRTWSPSPGPRRRRQRLRRPRRPGATAGTGLRSIDELFFGCYFSAGTMEREESGAEVPELARRMTLCSCRRDPARALRPSPDGHARRRHPAERHPR